MELVDFVLAKIVEYYTSAAAQVLDTTADALVTILVYLLVSLYALWVFFLAFMNIKGVYMQNRLSKFNLILSIPLLVVGGLLDALLNWIVMTVILFELPREITISQRLKRHNQAERGYRKWVAKVFEPILDPFDPKGDHI